ncbi:MBL fold metallo-hydrolase [Flavobacteriales bacterium]|nr:MBL fold metallo-hydrolase [Flavobacteriales bacterium]
MISVQKLTFNPFQENTYILFDETKECVIIDPGCYEEHEQNELKQFIELYELKPIKLISTHSHIDHVLGNKFVMDTYGIELQIHKQDLQTLVSVPTYAGNYGFTNYQACDAPSSFFEEGDKITFGNSELDILFVPGHAPGHVAFVAKEEKFVINGDCLFRESVGRVDLPGGDAETLVRSIKTKIFALSDEFVVYCGHGPETTIGFEKVNNRFLS